MFSLGGGAGYDARGGGVQPVSQRASSVSSTEGDIFLIDAVQRGEQAAWRQVIDRYEGRLVSFARRMLAQPSDAEDLVQETFVGLLRSLPSYDRTRSLETYLFAILRHKLHDHFRKTPRGQRESLDALSAEETEAAQPNEESPSGHLAGREATHSQREALVGALRRYVDQCRAARSFQELRVVETLFVLGRRNKDVAAELNLSATAVAGIKFRVIETLRKLTQAAAAAHDWSEADLAGDSSVGVIWREERISCLKRSTLGSYLLDVLDDDWQSYISFHVDELGCDICRANLDDLREEEARDASRREALRARCFASSVGFLSRPGSGKAE
ncbi:MAG: hypothetical protein CHACPFDD_03436 [Phycisphaerae bacterium]|nr:hypothetical protein [Phycisphaerae bacterium]